MFVVPSGSVGHQRLQPIRGLVELVELKQDTVTGKVTSVTFCIQYFVFVCTCVRACVCVCVRVCVCVCVYLDIVLCACICMGTDVCIYVYDYMLFH